MTCACAPALLVARNELNVAFPQRDKSSDGCCASKAHTAQNPTSDHEPRNGFARAFDFDETIGPGEAPLLPLKALFLADPRTKYVIYEGRIAYPDGTDKPYTGSNPHDKHLHLSIKDSAVQDTRPWGIASAFTQEDDVASARDEIVGRLDQDVIPGIENLTTVLGRMEVVLSDPVSGLAARIASLDPVVLVNAIPDEIAEAVADLLAERLKR